MLNIKQKSRPDNNTRLEFNSCSACGKHYQRLVTKVLFILYLKSATCNLFDICGCGYLSKTTRFRKESLYCSRKRQNPLTP